MPDDPDVLPGPHALSATPADAGRRTDRFLADGLPALSRSRVKALIEQGLLSRDGVVLSQPAAPISAGSLYVLNLPLLVDASPKPQSIPFPILFEDPYLLVLDKPAGLVVHPAPGNPDGTLVNALLAHCGDSLPGIGGERRPGIVHRLDKDTSGVMVVAKTEYVLAALSAKFAARDLERAYLALCWGLPSPASGEIAGAIGRDPRDRKRMAIVSHGGKPAMTGYTLRQSWHAAVALLECRLATGRTHQIRVHLASQAHPIVGDPVYLRRIPGVASALPAALRAALLDFPRQALHAATLGFTHPVTGAVLRFTTPAPPDMARLIAQLNEYS